MISKSSYIDTGAATIDMIISGNPDRELDTALREASSS